MFIWSVEENKICLAHVVQEIQTQDGDSLTPQVLSITLRCAYAGLHVCYIPPALELRSFHIPQGFLL